MIVMTWFGSRREDQRIDDALQRVVSARKEVECAAARLANALETAKSERMEITLTKLVQARQAKPDE